MSRLSVVAMVAGAILSAMSGDPGASQKRPLAAYLIELIGPSFVKCGDLGLFPTDAEARAAVECIDRHRADGTPAVLTQRDLSDDSYMAHGVVVDRQKRLISFSYDSAPCGGPSCDSRFDTAPCADLLIGTSSPSRFVGCRPKG